VGVVAEGGYFSKSPVGLDNSMEDSGGEGEEEVERAFGDDIAEQLRVLKAATSAARSSSAAGGEGGLGGGASGSLRQAKRGFESVSESPGRVSAVRGPPGPDGGNGDGSWSKRQAHSEFLFVHVDRYSGEESTSAGMSWAVGGGVEKSRAEKALEGLLDFEAGQGEVLMRSHGLLPRVTGTYRDLLANIGLGWIVSGNT